MTGLIVTVAVSLVKPQNFDWEVTRSINAESRDPIAPASTSVVDLGSETKSPATVKDDEEKERVAESLPTTPPSEQLPTVRDEEKEMAENARVEDSPSSLRGAFKLACISSFLLTFLMDFLASFALSLSDF